MGSSPVTATSTAGPWPALTRLDSALQDFFAHPAHALFEGDGLCVGFSAGADSLALLVGLARLRSRRPLRLVAAHLDHGLDADSAARARAAGRLAAALDVPFVSARRAVVSGRAGLEAAARSERYAYLEEVRRAEGCRYVLTAHHLDDQAETVALRLLLGSGLAGLSAVQPRRGDVVRPLLAIRRSELAEALVEAGLQGLEDPTNRLQRFPRNRLRGSILPRLARATPDLAPRLAALASAADGANRALDHRLMPWYDGAPGAPRLRLDRLAAAPAPLQLRALSLLHRLSGHPLPPSRRACLQLLAQLASGALLACDCGDGRRWTREGDALTVAAHSEPRTPSFTYTFQMPGHTFIPELGLTVAVRRSAIEPWMFEGSPWRAGLALPGLSELVVRNRRAGDRLRPLGSKGTRRLKDILIDARVPRAERDRLPLLCAGDEIAWIPGVTVNERFRLGAGNGADTVWAAEVTAP